MLERAVGLDPTYAPAWEALGFRYYYDSTYSNGGEAMYQRSEYRPGAGGGVRSEPCQRGGSAHYHPGRRR